MYGVYEELAGCRYFIPAPLAELPELKLSGESAELYGEAMLHLGRVDALAASLPDARALVKAYVLKESLLSSEIEGTVTTLTKVMRAAGSPRAKSEDRDTQDVVNYFKSANKALQMLRQENLPLAERVVKTAHAVLLDTEAGRSKTPGEYRKLPVAVGRHIPPPANRIPDLMKDLEAFLNANTYPPLLKAGIAHAQFETIHPFLDGNGRIGRLLIVLGFVHDGILHEPLIYPSYYFKRFRSEYYDRLDRVRLQDDWNGWLDFYLRAIKATAVDTEERMNRLIRLIQEYRKLLGDLSIRKSAPILSALLDNPVFGIAQLAEATGLSYPTAGLAVKKLERIGVLRQQSAQKRNKTYRLEQYMNILEEDTLF